VTVQINAGTAGAAPSIVSDIDGKAAFAKGAQAAVMHLQSIGAAESLELVYRLFPEAPLATILKRILKAANAAEATIAPA
jgi:hypothetical protein